MTDQEKQDLLLLTDIEVYNARAYAYNRAKGDENTREFEGDIGIAKAQLDKVLKAGYVRLEVADGLLANKSLSELAKEAGYLSREEVEIKIDEIRKYYKDPNYDPQAREFVWFVSHGWTSPEEIGCKIEKAKQEERERIRRILHSFGKITPKEPLLDEEFNSLFD